MDSCSLDFVNDLEAARHYQYMQCLECFFSKFFSQSEATGLGPAAD
jgi:hypothetical protein